MTILTSPAQLNRPAPFLSSSQLRVEERFQGPPQMGNGGYTAGLLAEQVGQPTVEVTLRQPVPLSRPLNLERLPNNMLLLGDEGTLIAEALPAALPLAVLPPPTYAQAAAARPTAAALQEHPFGHCFVCGPQREAGDGLGIFPGWVNGRDLVAAPWLPDASLADGRGRVRQRFLWAALDCPGAFALSGTSIRPMVLGRITATVYRTVSVGEPCVVTGWSLGRNGRKLFAGTALFNEQGRLAAKARAVWFEI